MNPRLSIITVVYNGSELLEETIQSVLKQSYDNIEYIIIDGDSKDGTMDIVNRYAKQVDIVVSEPDQGLYDAMNKGLAKATGDYVWFMNCGDWLHDVDTVKNIFQKEIGADVYYGKCMFVDDDRKELGLRSELTPHQLPQQLTWRSMKMGMVVSHQSFIAKRALVPMYMEGNLCADIEWVIDILKHSKKICFVDEVLSDFLIGGVSRKRHQESLRDRYVILSKHFGVLPNLVNHGLIVMRSWVHRLKRIGTERY